MLGIRRYSAFTLIELMIVISIIGILSVLSYAPYSYYANISRVRLSSERMAQVFGEARMAVLNGQVFSPANKKNSDIAVILRKGSSKIDMELVLPNDATFSTTGALRTIDLEDFVTLAALPTSAGDKDTVRLRFHSPNGEVTADDENGNDVIFSGGVVGLRGATTGRLSAPFTLGIH